MEGAELMNQSAPVDENLEVELLSQPNEVEASEEGCVVTEGSQESHEKPGSGKPEPFVGYPEGCYP